MRVRVKSSGFPFRVEIVQGGKLLKITVWMAHCAWYTRLAYGKVL